MLAFAPPSIALHILLHLAYLGLYPCFLVLLYTFYRFFIESHYTDIIVLCPKVTVSKLILQISMFIKYHQSTLSLSYPIKLDTLILGGMLTSHMNMVWHMMSFYNLYALVPTQLFYDVSYAFFILIIDYFSSILYRVVDISHVCVLNLGTTHKKGVVK